MHSNTQVNSVRFLGLSFFYSVRMGLQVTGLKSPTYESKYSCQ